MLGENLEAGRFTFCPFEIDLSPDNLKAIKNEVLSVPEEYWHFNEFRNCKMLSIYNPGGQLGKVVLGAKSEYAFTNVMENCPQLMELIQSQVFSWMEPKGRITILRTAPGQKMNVHLDCALTEVGTSQYKWRFVISGPIDKLFFFNENLQKVYIKSTHRSYVLDGGHPHSIDPSETEKITLCIGSPWKGNLTNQKYLSRLLWKEALVVQPPPIQTEWIDPILFKESI